jgi:hypothetical protein
MPHEKITVGANDYAVWGKLVKTWATGRNYVDHVMTEANPVPTAEEQPPKYPKPRSFAEFWEQCRAAKVGLVYDDGNLTPVPQNAGVALAVVQGDTDVFLLRLPPEGILTSHERRIIDNGIYKLPSFYDRIFGAQLVPGQQATKVQRMTVHAERIGDYTLSTCA